MPKNRPSRAKICPECHSTIFDSKFVIHMQMAHSYTPAKAKEAFHKAPRKSEFEGQRRLTGIETVPKAKYDTLEARLEALEKLVED